MMLNPHCIVLLWEVSKGVEYFLGGWGERGEIAI